MGKKMKVGAVLCGAVLASLGAVAGAASNDEDFIWISDLTDEQEQLREDARILSQDQASDQFRKFKKLKDFDINKANEEAAMAEGDVKVDPTVSDKFVHYDGKAQSPGFYGEDGIDPLGLKGINIEDTRSKFTNEKTGKVEVDALEASIAASVQAMGYDVDSILTEEFEYRHWEEAMEHKEKFEMFQDGLEERGMEMDEAFDYLDNMEGFELENGHVIDKLGSEFRQKVKFFKEMDPQMIEDIRAAQPDMYKLELEELDEMLEPDKGHFTKIMVITRLMNAVNELSGLQAEQKDKFTLEDDVEIEYAVSLTSKAMYNYDLGDGYAKMESFPENFVDDLVRTTEALESVLARVKQRKYTVDMDGIYRDDKERKDQAELKRLKELLDSDPGDEPADGGEFDDEDDSEDLDYLTEDEILKEGLGETDSNGKKKPTISAGVEAISAMSEKRGRATLDMNRDNMMKMMKEARKKQLERRQAKVRRKYGQPQASSRPKSQEKNEKFDIGAEHDPSIPLDERRKLRRRRLRVEAVQKRVKLEKEKGETTFDAEKGLEKISIMLDLERQKDIQLSYAKNMLREKFKHESFIEEPDAKYKKFLEKEQTRKQNYKKMKDDYLKNMDGGDEQGQSSNYEDAFNQETGDFDAPLETDDAEMARLYKDFGVTLNPDSAAAQEQRNEL